MSFAIPRYREPDFTALGLDGAPDVKLVPAERDGVMPCGYHATTLFPEYYHIGGRWVLAEDSRMDCVAVVRDGAVSIVEFRNVKAGELVVVGRTEDGSEGIYVHPNCFVDQSGEAEAFAFRTGAAGRPHIPSTTTAYMTCSVTSGSTAISFGSWGRPAPSTPIPGPPSPPWFGPGLSTG